MADERIIKNTWQIVGEIGAGGMGTVYEVRHVRLGKRYALKQLRQEFADRPDVKHRFDREAMTMAELQHPHIVQVYDIDVEPGFGAFILMDLIHGSNLGKIIREQGRRPYAEVLRLGCEIASALDFAHRRGVVHRDIKPGNILIEQGTGRAVLTDFGIAKQLNPDSDETEGTKTGVFVGTYRYSSPEQMRNEEPEPRWDIYSFGIVLYEAYSGNRFLENMTEGQVVAHVAYMPDWRPNLELPDPPPPEFRRIMEACLERDRERRIATAAELVEQLASCRNQFSETATASPQATPAAVVVPAVELPTAVTLQERYDGIRAALRAEAEGQINRLQRLEEDLATLGVSSDDWTSAGELRDRLAEVGELEEQEQFEKAMAALEALGERASEVHRSIESSLRDTLDKGIRELRDSWQSLIERAGDLVPSSQGVELNQLLAAAERCLASGDWMAGWRGLNEGRPLVERAERQARSQATSRTEGSLQTIGTVADTLRAAGSEAAATLDLERIRLEVAELIESGRLADAVGRAAAAAGEAERALDDLRRAQRQSAAEARIRLEQLVAELDIDAAAGVAQELVTRGRDDQRDAEAAEARNDFVSAAEAYEKAFNAFREAARLLQEKQEAELESGRAELKELISEAEAGPQAILGEIVEEARRVLADAATGDRRASLASVGESCAAVKDALTAAAAFSAAEEMRRRAEVSRDHVAQLQVAEREMRSAQQWMKEAAAAFKRERWSDARDGYQQAEAAWQALAREAEARDQQAKEKARRAEIQRLRDSLQGQLPNIRSLQEVARLLELDVAEQVQLGPLESALGGVAEREQQGKLDDALAEIKAAGDRARAAQTELEAALQAKLAEESAQVTQRWQDVESRAGDFLPAQLAEAVSGSLSSAESSMRAGEWQKGWQELAAGRAYIERAESETAERARQRVDQLLDEAQTHFQELSQAEASALVDGFDLLQLRQDVAARLERGLYAQAGALAESPLERLGTAVRRVRQTQQERLTDVRAEVEALATSFDSPEAQEFAANLLRKASAAWAEARKAEQGGKQADALSHFERARQAYQEASAEVTRQRLEKLSAQVRAMLETAPASVAQDSTQQARAALESASTADPAAAMAALARAREGLDAAFEQAKAREEAERELAQAKQRLQELVERSRDLPPAVASAAIDRAENVLADEGAKLAAVEEAELRLEQARAEAELFIPADERRAKAKAEEQAVLALQPSKRTLKAARKQLARADSAYEKREWKQASDAYDAALGELRAAKVAIEQRGEAAAEPRTRLPVGGIAAAAVAILIVGAVAYLRPWASTPATQSVLEETEPPAQPDLAHESRQEPAEAPVDPQIADRRVEEPKEEQVAAIPPDESDVAPQPAVRPLSIAHVSPSDSEVSVPEDGRVVFSVDLEGGPEGQTPPGEWTLAGKQVASNTNTFEYQPSFEDGRREPYDLTVRFGDGDKPLAEHSWKVRVDHVNRAPVLIDTSPPAGETIREKPGASVDFSVKAADPDDDDLQYIWTVGGQPAKEKGPELKLKVARSETVMVTVRDGADGERLTASWNVEAEQPPPTVVVAAIPPFKLEPKPAQLSRLRFKEPATFELAVPRDLREAKIDYAWTVDGRKVASGRSFRFDNDDPALVSGKPVRIRVEAEDEKKRSFDHEWKLTIVPPPPKIAGTEPPAGTLELSRGASQAFEIDASAPIGNQSLTYVFETNGKQTTSSKPRYDFVAGGEQNYTIVASIKDNYGQTSPEIRTWRVKVASQADVGQLVEGWLEAYKNAWVQKDTAKLAQLLKLDSEKEKALEQTLKHRRNFKLALHDVRIDKTDAKSATVSYKKVEEFVDDRTNKSVSLSHSLKRTFRVEGGRAVLVQ